MAQVRGELKTWHKVTVDFQGPERSETAATFRDYRLDVSFTNDKTGEIFVVPGYFAADGNAAETGATSGDVWRVYFNAPSQGEWTYAASFRTGTDVAASTDPSAGQSLAAFDGQSGSFTVGPTDKVGEDFRAKGMLEYTGEHYLRHAGTGEPFLKGGADSPENFLAYYEFDNGGGHHYDPHVADWRPGDPTWQGGEGKGIIGAVNYLADHGVNSQYFLTMNVQGDGNDVWPWVSPTAQTTYDVSKLDQWEIVFDHMDARGVVMHVVTQETENDQLLNDGDLGVERAIYYRELIARFGQHNGVVWNLGEENSNTDTQRKAFADYLKAVDPYDHPVVVHTFPGAWNEVYDPLLGFRNLDGPSLQLDASQAHTITLQWLEKSKNADQPWIVTVDEITPADSGVLPDGATGADANHELVRTEALWGNLMAGGAGVEWYFGYAYPHNDITLEDFGSRESVWAWTDHALDFFRAHLPFTEMQSADALTSDTGDYVFARPGQVYAIYLPDGGSTSLDLNGQTGTYEVKWYDPRNGGALKDGTVTEISGGGARSLGQAPSDSAKDWAVLVRQTDGSPTDESPTDEPPPDGVLAAINGGGGELTASDGTVYAADAMFSGGNTFSTSATVAGTTDDPLYQSVRWQAGGFSYDIPVVAGDYEVTLQFAEIYFTQPGQRVFDVALEGVERVSDLDVVAQVGPNTAHDVTLPVSVSDGSLDIDFMADVENPNVSAIRVVAAGASGTQPPDSQSPTDLDVTPKSFDEEGAYSGTLTATDPDSTSFTFTLLNDPSGLFKIQNTNQLELLQPVDFESLPAGFVDQGNGTATVDLTLEAQDESSNPFSELVTLTVNDVAEDGQAPTDPITLTATAGVLDGTASPQQWGVDVTIAALTANGSAAVITHSTDGFGVQGGRFDTQIDHMPSSNTSEQFTLEFNDAVGDVVLRFGRMNPDEGETGAWTAFDADGSKVASGVLDSANGTKIATWTYDIPIDAGGQSFAELLLTATGYNGGVSGASDGDSSDFAIKQLTYTPADPDEDSFSVASQSDDDLVDSMVIA